MHREKDKAEAYLEANYNKISFNACTVYAVHPDAIPWRAHLTLGFSLWDVEQHVACAAVL